MMHSYVKIPVGKLTLEGVMHYPDATGIFPAVVVCHPHPQYGGEMSNNVVMAICNGLCQQNIAALRFNFRGVGGSQGSYADGIGEQEDVKAALSFVAKDAKIDKYRIGLAGYSFGAGVSLAVAPMDNTVKAIALVSPPLNLPEWEAFNKYKVPKLIVGGSEDAFFPGEELLQHVQQLSDPKEYEIIVGPDHFWFGFEPQLAAKVIPFFKRHLISL